MSRKMKLFFSLLACLAMLSAASAQVMINEVLYDTQGTDDTSIMYTEIYGPPGTNLDGWSMKGVNGNGGTVYTTVALEGDIPDDGYFVIGGASVPNVDLIRTHDFQNAGGVDGPQCDGIDLYDGANTLIDHLCYGECAATEVCDGEGGSNAPDPFPSGGVNRAIARIPDHSDTDNNGVDFVSTEDQTPGLPNEGEPCVPVAATLSEIRENDGSGVPVLDGTFVITEGIATMEDRLIQADITSFYFQDADAGCNIFGGTVPQGIAAGDCLRVSGWVGAFRGLTEIEGSGSGNCVFSCQVIGHTDVPEPAILTCNSFFEAYEGMLVTIEDVTILGGDAWPTEGNDADIEITDGNGSIIMRIDKETTVDGSPEPEGAFNVTGIMTQYDFDAPYDADYQLFPRYPSDIDPIDAADDPIGEITPVEFRFDGAFPNPFNSTTNIRFTVGNARDLTVRVFDLLGREVASEKLTGLTPGTHNWNWTPSGATGLYVVRMDSQNLTETAKVLYLK
jgi:hypothetical protein